MHSSRICSFQFASKIDLDERERERKCIIGPFGRAFRRLLALLAAWRNFPQKLKRHLARCSRLRGSLCPSVLTGAHNVCLWHPKDPSLWIISVLVPEEINSPSRLISGGKNERKIIRGEKFLGEKSRGAKSGKRRHPVFRKKG